MLSSLTTKEKELMSLIIYGQTYVGISEMLGVDKTSYIKLKNSLLKKLKVKKITKILPYLMEQGYCLSNL